MRLIYITACAIAFFQTQAAYHTHISAHQAYSPDSFTTLNLPGLEQEPKEHNITQQELPAYDSYEEKQFNPNTCICGVESTSEEAFTRHINSKHRNGNVFECPVCPQIVSGIDVSKIKRHIRTHTKACTLKCPYCSDKFRESSTRKDHIAAVHYSKEALAQKFAIMLTNGLKQFVCRTCNKIFDYKTSIIRHVVACNKIVCYQDEIIEVPAQEFVIPDTAQDSFYHGEDWPDLAPLLAPEEVSQLMRDENSGLLADTCTTTTQHTTPAITAAPEQYLFSCMCRREKFPTRKAVLEHINRCHRFNKQFFCIVCEYTCPHATLLLDHIDIWHSGKKIYRCEPCNKSFHTLKAKQMHMRKSATHKRNAAQS